MQLAFLLYKYFPFGGLQRDFLRIARVCQQRGHAVRVYVMAWEGERPSEWDIRLVPVKALSNHRRNEKFAQWVQVDLARDPVDRVVGFNKMPGLDIYYAADGCYEDKAQNQRNWLYQFGPRYRHFSAAERAVFTPEGRTEILMISEVQLPLFMQHYRTPIERFHLLPPGITADRRAPANAAEIRIALRKEFDLTDDELLLVQIGSGFKTKGLDRTLEAVAALPPALRQRTRLIVIGADNPGPFQPQIRSLGLSDRVQILAGRDDVPRFLLGADLLIHPAYNENTGTVLLEALVAGLPVLTTEACGYAHYIEEADCGLVVPHPFEQKTLNEWLARILDDPETRQEWQENALDYAEHADLYSMPERAADVILGDMA